MSGFDQHRELLEKLGKHRIGKSCLYIYKLEDVDKEELRKLLELYIYICNNCGKEYDEAKMGILFKDLPEDFKCPGCEGPKGNFKKKI